MNGNDITSFELDPAASPKADWTAFDAMTADEARAAALADPDARPATAEQLARAHRVVRVQLIRKAFGLSQEEFARRFGLEFDILCGWEDGSIEPDTAAVTLLRIIWHDPDAVRRVVAAE